jgi:hypothetical protein
LLFPSIRCSRSSTAIFLDNKPSYGHIIAAACFIIQAVGIGTYVTYGVFFNSLMAEFQWPRAIISGASSLAFF